MRLNKILSAAGVASRRLADELIRQGRVNVNDRVVTALGTRADPSRDVIRVDGRRLKAAPARRYLLLYKPPGVVSTRVDPAHRPTVLDLVADAGIRGYFYPVGRLDFDSEGLILVTNDGAFAERVMHPRYELARTYEAHVAGVPDERDLARLRRGVDLDGRRTRPARVRLLRHVPGSDGPRAVIEITIREGRKRQVRRMCDAIAHPVERLCRTRIGNVTLAGLRPGRLRDLTAAEVAALMPRRAPASRSGPGARRRPAGRRGGGSRA